MSGTLQCIKCWGRHKATTENFPQKQHRVKPKIVKVKKRGKIQEVKVFLVGYICRKCWKKDFVKENRNKYEETKGQGWKGALKTIIGKFKEEKEGFKWKPSSE